MRNAILLCIVTFLFMGCGRPGDMARIGPAQTGFQPMLAEISIERWGEQRFRGILALQQGGEGIGFTILDPTGVTLLSGMLPVRERGGYEGVLKDSVLADYLGEAIWRIFALEPENRPCSGAFLREFCIQGELSDESFSKWVAYGPFRQWTVVRQGRTYMYEQSWIGVRIQIEDKAGEGVETK